MTGRTLAVCDADEKYITAFTRRVGKEKSAGLEVHAFTGTKALLEYAGKRMPDLLLINEALCGEEISGKFRGRLFILTEQRPSDDDTKRTAKQGTEEQFTQIYKYQAASDVMRQVLGAFSGLGAGTGTDMAQKEDEIAMSGVGRRMQKPQTEMIGVYSPLGRCGKTSFALALALKLQRTRPTLFLSFEIFSGWKHLYPQAKHAAGSLADGIYYLRNGNPKVAEKLLAEEQKMGELSFLPPFSDPQDLLHVTDEEWKCVLDSIRYETGFEAVVADLGIVPAFCPAVLLNFSRIFLPVADGYAAQGKLQDFEAYLRKNLLDTEMKERMREVHLPDSSGESGFQENPLLYGELEDFVDALIRQENL